ncbi:MAG: CobD/CbiB family protein [Gammaproteobacteria bacterium]|nr:CobD/CbiB family protein [Gammaproteobacteria bacterium]MBU1646344.1 CobD/CbiB family protein [Gammaproteobacteria bacterium]MBU1970887.1 CobD/CbiB family protein [Gammaproteobacteria bacterium]
MSLFSIIFALAIEQVKPLSGARVDALLAAYGRQLEAWFNAGERHHGVAAWCVGVGVPTAIVLGLHVALAHFAPPLVLALSVGVLYLTVGFRQYSHFFTDIHLALRLGEIDQARALLGEWRGVNSDRLSPGEVARLAIEQALLHSHRHVFAPLFLFMLFGPAGAVLYRLSLALSRLWGEVADAGVAGTAAPKEFGQFARQAQAVVDWLPQRATATAFAVVGDFEDAVYCWRTQSEVWPDAATGILLASGAGALGVRLGMPVQAGMDGDDRPILGTGDDADVDFMQSTIGLVWRTLVLGILLLALFWVASWVG